MAHKNDYCSKYSTQAVPTRDVLKSMPFSQKVSVLLSVDKDYSASQISLVDFIKDELLEEQSRIFKKDWQSSFQSHTGKHAYQQAFKKEFVKLNMLIDAFKTFAKNEHSHSKEFFGLVFSLIAAIRYTYNRQYTVYDWIRHPVVTSGKVKIKKAAESLCNDAIDIIANDGHYETEEIRECLTIYIIDTAHNFNKKEINRCLTHEEASIALAKRIERILEAHKFDKVEYFSRNKFTILDKRALINLKNYLLHKEGRWELGIEIMKYKYLFEKHNILSPLFKKFFKLHPLPPHHHCGPHGVQVM